MPDYRTQRESVRRALTLACISTCVLAGCAHHGRLRPGGAAALVVVGTLATVAGVAAVAGCSGLDGEPDSCTGSSDSGDVPAGISLVVVGAAMVATAVYLRPKGNVSPLSPRAPLPSPVLPDPLDKPLKPNP